MSLPPKLAGPLHPPLTYSHYRPGGKPATSQVKCPIDLFPLDGIDKAQRLSQLRALVLHFTWGEVPRMVAIRGARSLGVLCTAVVLTLLIVLAVDEGSAQSLPAAVEDVADRSDLIVLGRVTDTAPEGIALGTSWKMGFPRFGGHYLKGG